MRWTERSSLLEVVFRAVHGPWQIRSYWLTLLGAGQLPAPVEIAKCARWGNVNGVARKEIWAGPDLVAQRAGALAETIAH